jgi:hypothetical protein
MRYFPIPKVFSANDLGHPAPENYHNAPMTLLSEYDQSA